MFDWLLNPLSECLRWLLGQRYHENLAPTPTLSLLPLMASDLYADMPVGMPVSYVAPDPSAVSPAAPASEPLTASPVNPPTPDLITQYLTKLTQIPFEKRISTSGKPSQYVSALYSREELVQLTERFPELKFSVAQSRNDPSQYRLTIRENKIDQKAVHFAP